jgi:hypothetical protein
MQDVTSYPFYWSYFSQIFLFYLKYWDANKSVSLESMNLINYSLKFEICIDYLAQICIDYLAQICIDMCSSLVKIIQLHVYVSSRWLVWFVWAARLTGAHGMVVSN